MSVCLLIDRCACAVVHDCTPNVSGVDKRQLPSNEAATTSPSALSRVYLDHLTATTHHQDIYNCMVHPLTPATGLYTLCTMFPSSQSPS